MRKLNLVIAILLTAVVATGGLLGYLLWKKSQLEAQQTQSDPIQGGRQGPSDGTNTIPQATPMYQIDGETKQYQVRISGLSPTAALKGLELRLEFSPQVMEYVSAIQGEGYFIIDVTNQEMKNNGQIALDLVPQSEFIVNNDIIATITVETENPQSVPTISMSSQAVNNTGGKQPVALFLSLAEI